MSAVAGTVTRAQAQAIVPNVLGDDKIRVRFDCFLEKNVTVDCQNLKQAFFNAVPFLTPVDQGQDLLISVRAIELNRIYQFYLTFDGEKELPDFTLIENNILKTISPNAAMLILLGDLQKCLAPYLLVLETGSEAAQSKDDKLAGTKLDPNLVYLKLKNPKGSIVQSESRAIESGWMLSLRGNGRMNFGQINTFSLDFMPTLNYSSLDWRVRAGGDVFYQKVTINSLDGTQSSQSQEVTSFGGRVLVAKSMNPKQWSIAALTSVLYAPESQNIDFQMQVGAGLEWDLVPFLKVNDRSVGVRYSIHAVYNNYTYPNVENKLDQIFFRHGISFYMNWHWDRLDLSSHLDLISQVDQYTYLQTMLGMTLVYRITDELSVQFSPTLGYRRAVINAPNPSNSQASALEQFVAGQNYSNWTFMSMFGLNYVFGNVRLNQQDQRWLKH